MAAVQCDVSSLIAARLIVDTFSFRFFIRLKFPVILFISIHSIIECAWYIFFSVFYKKLPVILFISIHSMTVVELYWEVIGSWCFPQKTKLSDNFWFAMTPFDWVSIDVNLNAISLFIPLYRYVMSTNFTLQMGTCITNPGVARIR